MDEKIFSFLFLIFFGLIILVICITVSIFLKGFKLRHNPNNGNIKKFIRFAKRLYIMPDNPTAWGSLRKTYHKVSENENIDYELRVELFEVLKKRGVMGLYYPKKPDNYISLEQRLDELEILFEKKKITEEEYKKRRSMILNS